MVMAMVAYLKSTDIKLHNIFLKIFYIDHYYLHYNIYTYIVHCTHMYSNAFSFFLFFFSADKTPAGFPIITQSPQTRVVEIGHTAVMQCRSTGNPIPKIFWLKDSVRLDMSNSRYSLIDGKFYSCSHSFNCRFNTYFPFFFFVILTFLRYIFCFVQSEHIYTNYFPLHYR